MTKVTNTTAHTVTISSGAQDMFQSGAAKEIGFSDYVPIIGGGITELTATGVFALDGRATVDGDKIVWDDQGKFDGLANGEVVTTAVIWDVIDADGNLVAPATDTPRGMEIEVRGTANGPVFTNKTTGEVSTDGMTVVAFTAKEMLRDVHDFAPVKLVDIGLDIDELLDIDLGEVTQDVADMAELVGLAGKIGGLELAAQAAAGTLDLAQKAADALDDLRAEQRTAEFAKNRAEDIFDAADDAVDFAEDLVDGAKDVLAGAIDAVGDAGEALGDFLGDAAFALQIGALEAELFASENAGIFDFFLRDPADVQRDINKLNADKRALEIAERNERDAENELQKFARDLDRAEVDFSDAKDALDQAETAFDNAVDDVAEAVENFRKDFQGQTIATLDGLSRAADTELAQAKSDLFEKFSDLQDRGLFQDVSSSFGDLADTILKLGLGAAKELDALTFDVLGQIDAAAKVEVEADAFAQAGLIVDFQMSGGSVESNLDYDLTSVATLDDVADTFTITAQAQSATTGDAVAFETLSPNMSFFAGIAYNAGATFDVLVDLFAEVADTELFNLGPITHSLDVAFDGVISLIDFDSTEFDGFELPIPGFLGDIFEAEVNFPTVETQGKAAEFSADPYTDPTSFVDLDKIADLIVNLTETRLEFSEEFQSLLAKRGAETKLTDDSFEAAIKQAIGALMDSLGDEGDTDGDGFVPVLQVKTGELGADALVHLDTIKPDLSDLDLENGGEFGFFVSQGASNNLVEMRLDVDQLIATAVNVALGNSPQSTINPLDLSIGIGEVLDLVGVPEKVQVAVDEVLTLDLNVQLADLDVRAGANFSQEFALSVDDIDFQVTFEDGTTSTASADEGGQIVIENASGLIDTNGNGEIDYTLALTPDATLFNDTELGLNVGYTLDFLKAQLNIAAGLPLDALIPGLGDVDVFTQDLSLGPILQLTGDLDVISADVFESLFDFNAGTGAITGAFTQSTGGVIDTPTVADGPITGTKGSDLLQGTEGRDKINAKAGDDVVLAGGGRDIIKAGAGNDEILAEAGNDRVAGGKGVDFLSGGKGKDVLIGGKGQDFLQGDEGADTFKFAKGHGENAILDFELGLDTIAIGKGAGSIDDLTFTQEGAATEVAFANVTISVENMLVEDLLAANAFDF